MRRASSSGPSAPGTSLELEPFGAEELVRARVHVLEEEDFDLVLRKGRVRFAGHEPHLPRLQRDRQGGKRGPCEPASLDLGGMRRSPSPAEASPLLPSRPRFRRRRPRPRRTQTRPCPAPTVEEARAFVDDTEENLRTPLGGARPRQLGERELHHRRHRGARGRGRGGDGGRTSPGRSSVAAIRPHPRRSFRRTSRASSTSCPSPRPCPRPGGRRRPRRARRASRRR